MQLLGCNTCLSTYQLLLQYLSCLYPYFPLFQDALLISHLLLRFTSLLLQWVICLVTEASAFTGIRTADYQTIINMWYSNRFKHNIRYKVHILGKQCCKQEHNGRQLVTRQVKAIYISGYTESQIQTQPHCSQDCELFLCHLSI